MRNQLRLVVKAIWLWWWNRRKRASRPGLWPHRLQWATRWLTGHAVWDHQWSLKDRSRRLDCHPRPRIWCAICHHYRKLLRLPWWVYSDRSKSTLGVCDPLLPSQRLVMTAYSSTWLTPRRDDNILSCGCSNFWSACTWVRHLVSIDQSSAVWATRSWSSQVKFFYPTWEVSSEWI